MSLVFLRMMACKLLTLDGHRVSVWALVLGMKSCEPLMVGGKRIFTLLRPTCAILCNRKDELAPSVWSRAERIYSMLSFTL